MTPTWNDNFGFSVAISDGTAIVGSYGDDNDSGAVYLYPGSAAAVAPVPLPAGMWLMVSGLASLGLARRRFKPHNA